MISSFLSTRGTTLTLRGRAAATTMTAITFPCRTTKGANGQYDTDEKYKED